MPNVRANVKPNTEKALTPLAYVIRAITLINHKGEKADIQNIVTDFSITESLYSAGMMLRLSIKDTANFIEEYQLIGQEIIEVNIGRHDYTSPDWIDVKLKFWVTEYPVYGRDRQHNTQVYSITGITQHAYASQFKIISRGISGLVSDEIRRVFENDVQTPKIGTWDKTASRFSGVLPLLHPLDAAYWLLRRAYDDQSAPFFLYETLRGGVNLSSLTNLISKEKNPIYRTYNDGRYYSTEPGSIEDFYERLNRIYTIASDFKLSKVLPTVANGAYASSNAYLDIATKTIKTEIFDYQKKLNSANTLNGNTVLSDKFKVPMIDEPKISDTFNGFTEYFPTNSLSYSSDGSIFNYHTLMVNRAGMYNSKVETLDTIVHDVTVAGDFNMCSGKKIILQVPKSIDPEEFEISILKGNADELYDRTISGIYLVTGVVHQFSSQYFCKLRLKRDSFTYDVNKS